jgi:hypothetical protein
MVCGRVKSFLPDLNFRQAMIKYVLAYSPWKNVLSAGPAGEQNEVRFNV